MVQLIAMFSKYSVFFVLVYSNLSLSSSILLRPIPLHITRYSFFVASIPSIDKKLLGFRTCISSLL